MYSGTLRIEGRFRGMLDGTAIVSAGTTAEIAGMVNGSLIVEAGAVAHVSGMVNGAIRNRGGTVTVSGMVSD